MSAAPYLIAGVTAPKWRRKAVLTSVRLLLLMVAHSVDASSQTAPEVAVSAEVFFPEDTDNRDIRARETEAVGGCDAVPP